MRKGSAADRPRQRRTGRAPPQARAKSTGPSGPVVSRCNARFAQSPCCAPCSLTAAPLSTGAAPVPGRRVKGPGRGRRGGVRVAYSRLWRGRAVGSSVRAHPLLVGDLDSADTRATRSGGQGVGHLCFETPVPATGTSGPVLRHACAPARRGPRRGTGGARPVGRCARGRSIVTASVSRPGPGDFDGGRGRPGRW